MIRPIDSIRSALAKAGNEWQRFWFLPQPAYTLGLVRIAFGLLMVGWTLSLLPGFADYFGSTSVAAQPILSPYRWTVFAAFDSDVELVIGLVLLLASAITMMLGWHARLASIAVCVLVLSFQHANPAIFNSGDTLIRAEALFLALAPCGAALSLDQRRRTGTFWSAQVRAPWGLRLLQLQLSIVYLASVRWKMSGDAWPRGTAVSYALRLPDMTLLPAPHWFTANAILVNVATWAALALEFCIGVFVWNRRLRPWLLAAGVLMHSAIAISIAVGFFSQAMFVLYLAFVSPQLVQRAPDVIRRRLTRARHSRDDLGEATSVDPDGGITPAAPSARQIDVQAV